MPQSKPLTIDEIAAITKAATKQRQRVRWIDIAKTIRALEQSSGAPYDENNIRWSDHVAKAAALSGTQIVTMLRAHDMLQQLAASGEITAIEDYADLTVDAVDTINRYLSIDRAAALQALRSRPSSREARRLYTAALQQKRSTHGRSQRVGRALSELFAVRVLAIYRMHCSYLHAGPVDPLLISAHPMMDKSIAVALNRVDGSTTGLQGRQYSSAPVRKSHRAHLAQSLLDATFVDRLWIMIDDHDTAREIDADLTILDARNIGVIVIPPFDPESPFAFEIWRQVTPGSAPTPDRRHHLAKPQEGTTSP